MTVIGPNGKDVYCVSAIISADPEDNKLILHSFMTEALSYDEAVGKAQRMVKQYLIQSKYSEIKLILVNSVVK